MAVDPVVIPAIAIPANSGDPASLDLFALPIPAAILARHGHGEELLLRFADRSVRLSIVRGMLLAGPIRLQFLLNGIGHLDQRLAALKRLATLFGNERVQSSGLAGPAALARRRLLLRTLDALAVDARHRQVATTLFGADRVSAEWQGRSDYLRSQVRRLIRRARTLVAGGYLDIFRTGDIR